MYAVPPLYTCRCGRSCVLCVYVELNRIRLVFIILEKKGDLVDLLGLDNTSGWPLHVAHAEPRKGDLALLAFGCALGWAAQQQKVSCVAFVATSELQSPRQHVAASLFGI